MAATTTTLSKGEMGEFITRVIAEAADMGVTVPPANFDRQALNLVSSLHLGPWMDEVYNEHSIRADAEGAPDGWHSVVQVSWKEDGVTKVKLWIDARSSFTSRARAESEGRSAARRWIDEGKPENETPSFANYQHN
jgi:hypothetical protein